MLTQNEIKIFYDRFGEKQDSQGFYEDIATHALAAHGLFDQAKSVFEYGLGTGRFAEKLLNENLSNTCRYFGIDLSATMVALATNRLTPWADRCDIRVSDSALKLPHQDATFDRFVCNYVLDLLSREETSAIMDEAHRILAPNGLLCLVSLTHGKTWFTRGISHTWQALYRLKPTLVGGCRPIELGDFISEAHWKTEYSTVVAAFGISSEIVVARRRP